MRFSPLTRAGADVMVCTPGGWSLGLDHALLPMVPSPSPGNSASCCPLLSSYLHDPSAFMSTPSLKSPTPFLLLPLLSPEMCPELRWLSKACPRLPLHFSVLLLYRQSQFSFQGSPQKKLMYVKSFLNSTFLLMGVPQGPDKLPTIFPVWHPLSVTPDSNTTVLAFPSGVCSRLAQAWGQMDTKQY